MIGKTSSEQIQRRYEFACSIAREAGKLTLRYFQGAQLQVERKADHTPVTIADREAESLLRSRIEEAFPEDGIVGEEFPDKPGEGPFRWVLDPIDGTKSFVCGVPLYGTLIGVLYGNTPKIGVIELPALNEGVQAAWGQGAWYRRDSEIVPCQVSSCRQLSEAILLTSDRQAIVQRGDGDWITRLEAHCRMTRTWGDCYGYVLVATGRADVMLDASLQIWDAAPLLPILHEAGGNFTCWQGRACIDGGDGIGTNAKLLPQVLSLRRTVQDSSS